MSTELQNVNTPNTFQDAVAIGEVFFKSGLFSDVKSASQAVVKIQAGAEIGIPPFQAISNVHVIQGKPSIGAHLMAAKIKASGKYKYKVVKHDDKVCHIDFFEKDNGSWEKIGDSIFTIEDARKARSQNLDKYPRNMLFARAISNGLRWHCPDVFSGAVYVQEELIEATTSDTVKTQERASEASASTVNIDVLNPESEEDIKIFNALSELFNNPVLPEKLNNNTIDVKATFDKMESDFHQGALQRESAIKWGKYLHNQVELLKNNESQGEELG